MHVVCDVFKFNETTPMVFFLMIGGFFWGQSTWYLKQSMHWKVYISFAKNIVQPSLHFRIRWLFVKLIIHWQRAWSVQATIMFHNETCNKPEPFWNLCLICLHICAHYLAHTYIESVCIKKKLNTFYRTNCLMLKLNQDLFEFGGYSPRRVIGMKNSF